MKVAGIIHQQICQLRWHLPACLGLIMVLPVEEAKRFFLACFCTAQEVPVGVSARPVHLGFRTL